MVDHKSELCKYSMDLMFKFDENGKIIGVDENNVFYENDLQDYKDNYIKTVKGTVRNDWYARRISDDTMLNVIGTINKTYPHLEEMVGKFYL